MKTGIDDGAKIGFINVGMNNDTDCAQWLVHNTSARLSPEKKLLEAILEDAIEVATAPIGYGRKYSREIIRRRERERNAARAWIADYEADWVFSFASCCEALGLSPDRIRKELQEKY